MLKINKDEVVLCLKVAAALALALYGLGEEFARETKKLLQEDREFLRGRTAQ